MNLSDIKEDAVALLRELCNTKGILASLLEEDNYRRIWARDSIVCGLAGLLLKDEVIIEGLKNSLLTLAAGQHESGMIPSNISAEDPRDVSYGSLAGRVDTNTWFILGVSLYYKHSRDGSFLQQLQPNVLRCRSFLRSIEFNGRGWIYTPLSGNWADEYPVHGYTLYDNSLRIWAELMWSSISGISTPDVTEELILRTKNNFWPGLEDSPAWIYQRSSYEKAISSGTDHFAAFILPGVYDLRFDAAANAIAMLVLGLEDSQRDRTSSWLDQLAAEVGRPAIPAFWPVITESDNDWPLLRDNYSFAFKNQPGRFHNGGIWPVWMGLYCLGLKVNKLDGEVSRLITSFLEVLEASDNFEYHEFINANTLGFEGKRKMGYTASGIVFMWAAEHYNQEFLTIFRN